MLARRVARFARVLLVGPWVGAMRATMRACVGAMPRSSLYKLKSQNTKSSIN